MTEEYQIVVRGRVPDNLRELISGIHAFAVLRNSITAHGGERMMGNSEIQRPPTAIEGPTSTTCKRPMSRKQAIVGISEAME